MLPTIPRTIDVKTVCDAVFQEVVESHETNGRCTFMGTRLSESGDMEFYYFTDLNHTPIPVDVRILDWYTKAHRGDANGCKRCANPVCNETGCTLKCATCVETCAVFYCSPGCQKQHWPTHRLECRKLMSARDFWRWYMTGKCSILHSAVCELLEIIRDKYCCDTIVTMSDGTTKRVVNSKLAEPARFIKREMVEVVSVYDIPLQKIRGQVSPKLGHYHPRNVDRLMHTIGLDCSAAHPARCANPSHIGLHQMLALQLESDTGADAIMLMDLTGAQFGVGLEDLADRGSYLRTYCNETELNAAGFTYVESSDFEDSDLWYSRQIRDPVKESAAEVLYHLVKTCEKKLFASTKNNIPMYVDPDNSVGSRCNACGSVAAKKKCSRCGLVFYCGIACQKGDWVSHKTVCRVAEK